MISSSTTFSGFKKFWSGRGIVRYSVDFLFSLELNTNKSGEWIGWLTHYTLISQTYMVIFSFFFKISK